MTDHLKTIRAALELSSTYKTAEALTALEALEAAMREPCAFMFQHDETGRTTIHANDGVNDPYTFTKMNPRWHYIGPCFAAPPAQQEPCCVNYAAGTNCFSDPRIDCPRLPPAQQAQAEAVPMDAAKAWQEGFRAGDSWRSSAQQFWQDNDYGNPPREPVNPYIAAAPQPKEQSK